MRWCLVGQADALLVRLVGDFSALHRDSKAAAIVKLLGCWWGLEKDFTWDWLTQCVESDDKVHSPY